MAARPGPGDQDRRNNGWLGASDAVAAPYDGYARNEAGNERAYQNYPPLHNQSNPSLSTSQSNLSMKKNETMVSERYVTRTPSPTPSEQAFLERKGVVDWKKISNWRFWARREWIWYYVIGGIILIITILISVYDRQIVKALQPSATNIRDLPAGWLIPIAIFFIISFPPLFGHEIIAILCGVVWGLWIGFAITAAGTFVGEVGDFYAFRYCCRARGDKYEKTKLLYGALAKVVREGGFRIALIARYSAIPGHFTTAVFSTCGMHILTFAAAAFLSLPKQFVTVYIGVIIKESGLGTESTKDKLISYAVVAATSIITAVAMWYIYREIEKVKYDIVHQRRKARQVKLARAEGFDGSSVGFNPRESDSDLPLNPGEHSHYQQWDSRGQATGVSGDPNLMRAPQPHRPLSSSTDHLSPVNGSSRNPSPVNPTAPVPYQAAPNLESNVRPAFAEPSAQRQGSMDTAAWDMSSQGTDVYRLPTIARHSPLSGGFTRPLSPHNPFRPQQQRQPMAVPVLGRNQGHAVMSPVATEGAIPPPLAPPPSSPSAPHPAASIPHSYEPPVYSPVSPHQVPMLPSPYPASPTSAHSFPHNQPAQYPLSNPYTTSAPQSPQQTPRQQTFPSQVQNINSTPGSPVWSLPAYGVPPPSGPPPSFNAPSTQYPAYISPGGGAHAQIPSDETAYYTPQHSRVTTEQFDHLPSPGANNYSHYPHGS